MADLHFEVAGTKPEILTDEQLGRMVRKGDESAFLDQWERACDALCSVIVSRLESCGTVNKAAILAILKHAHDLEDMGRRIL